jgi:hypothetical protein
VEPRVTERELLRKIPHGSNYSAQPMDPEVDASAVGVTAKHGAVT